VETHIIVFWDVTPRSLLEVYETYFTRATLSTATFRPEIGD